LLVAALRLALPPAASPETTSRPVPLPLALGLGGAIGLLAGLTGVGGGIFLSPVLLFLHAGTPRAVAAVSAPFILLNSVAGLAGNPASLSQLPATFPWLLAATATGGLLGSYYGSFKIPGLGLKRLLALVLVIAAVKMILS
jgi:hypothetical protein